MNFQLRALARDLALASALLATGSAALAANDGDLDSTSTGDLDITMEVADRVQISGLTDIPLGAFDGATDLVGSDTFCVYRNGTGTYDITISSANDLAGVPAAADGANKVAYDLLFDADNDASNSANGSVVESLNDTFTDQAGHATDTSCGGADNASIQVTFAATDLLAAPTGNYTDTITFVVAPK